MPRAILFFSLPGLGILEPLDSLRLGCWKGQHGLMLLWIVGALVFALNVPFGYWRAQTRKFSAQWLLAIHLPVPLVIACRVLSGLGWHLVTFPVLIGAFFFGQFAGGRLYRILSDI